MKAQRYNPCTPVRLSLITGGYSTVRIMHAVNAALGSLENIGEESKLAGSTISRKKNQSAMFKVAETTVAKFTGQLTAPLAFDAWNTAIEKANKVMPFESVGFPPSLMTWLAKFKATDDDKKAESNVIDATATDDKESEGETKPEEKPDGETVTVGD